MNLIDCLPAALQANAAITPIAAGMSGAGVYRVDSGGRAFVLKIAAPGDADVDWQRTTRIEQQAAEAGLSPPVVHVDPARRAVLTAFVADRSLARHYLDPSTREATLALIGRTVGRIHALPLPADAPRRDPHAMLAHVWRGLAGVAVPAFVAPAIERALAAGPPGEVAPVLGHNDLNPTNLLHDGERLQVLDWAVAGAADPFYDLAVLAVFLRMDDATCARLLSAHGGAPVAALPARFRANRLLAAALVGTVQLHLASQRGHRGSSDESLATTPSLADLYARMSAGQVQVGTPAGQWLFGLSLLRESLGF